MIVKKYKASIEKIENEIEGVYTLTFRPEKGQFKYFPGQFLHLALDADYDGSGQWPESRCFSLQSSPSEEFAKISYAVKGVFTRIMEKEIKLNSEIWLKMPYGDLFEQEHNKSKTVFVAGGTGVTPFLSLFTSPLFKDYVNPHIYLGFRSRNYNIYEKELNSGLNPSAVVKCFYQDVDGVIDIEKIFNENGTNASYFISGPPIMIKLFKDKLKDKGVPNSNILTDDWE